MNATPLTDIHLPDSAVNEMAAINVDTWITNHRMPVSRQWWTDKLTGAGIADTVLSSAISRGEIFELAAKAAQDPDAALALLWNSLAWGSGNKLRNNGKRIASVADDTARASALLMEAATLGRTSPFDAYELLYPQQRGVIHQLGPAFFTKYLYFAGGGSPTHPCAILDENVARALRDSCGWKSLPVEKAGWYTSTYDRYCTLLGTWVQQHNGIGRRDIIERWLFEEGKRLAPPRTKSHRSKRS
ncbi:MAG: hypothetical protein ACOYEV_12015 [Candidatus Nanopelagicales bacterium]